MAKIKEAIKAVTPEIIITAFKNFKRQEKIDNVFSGNYNSWTEAKSKSSGYESNLILQKCESALFQVKNGEAVYERDSVLFDEIQYSWPVLASLQKTALDNKGKLTVLDFGGSLGSSYFQNKEFLKGLLQLQWCIVEQPHFVEAGKNNFENEQLKFYHTIEECLQHYYPDVLLLSSVLQYLSEPYELIQKLIALAIPYIIIDRTAFINNERDVLTIQNTPPEIYKASYPAWFFNERNFIAAFTNSYHLISDFADSFTNPGIVDGNACYWKGYFLKKANG